MVAQAGYSLATSPLLVPVPLPSMAVLPFAELSPVGDQGHCSDGLAPSGGHPVTRTQGGHDDGGGGDRERELILSAWA